MGGKSKRSKFGIGRDKHRTKSSGLPRISQEEFNHRKMELVSKYIGQGVNPAVAEQRAHAELIKIVRFKSNWR